MNNSKIDLSSFRPSGPRSGRVSQRQKKNKKLSDSLSLLLFVQFDSFFQTSETPGPDEVILIDGVAPQEKTGDMNSTTPRATCGGGESGAGAPPARRTWRCVLRRVGSESRAGGRPPERREW